MELIGNDEDIVEVIENTLIIKTSIKYIRVQMYNIIGVVKDMLYGTSYLLLTGGHKIEFNSRLFDQVEHRFLTYVRYQNKLVSGE